MNVREHVIRAWPAAVAAVGLVLAFAGTWPAGGLVAGSPARTLIVPLPPALLVVVMLAVAGASAALIASLLPQRRRKDPEDFVLEPPSPPRLSPVVLLALLALLAAGAAAILWLVRLVEQPLASGGIASLRLPPAPTPRPSHAVASALLHVPAADWGLMLVMAAIAVGAIGFALWVIMQRPWSSPRSRRRRMARLAEALHEAADQGIDELTDEFDPRRAVIACYRRCEQAVFAQRHRRYPWQTPREFLASALAALALPPEPVATLLGVFERARFGNDPMNGQDRAAAVGALETIRGALTERGTHETGR